MTSASPPHPVSPKSPSKTLTSLWGVTLGKFITLTPAFQSARAASAEVELTAVMKMPSVRLCWCQNHQSWAKAMFATSNTSTTPSSTAVRLRAFMADLPLGRVGGIASSLRGRELLSRPRRLSGSGHQVRLMELEIPVADDEP